MIEKVTQMNLLLDQYETLLTDKQRIVAIDYYQQDLSLQEIADNQGVSKNAIYDSLKRTEQLLLEYETNLNLVAKNKRLNQLFSDIKACKNPEIEKLLKAYEEENYE